MHVHAYRAEIDDGKFDLMGVTGPWIFTSAILDYLGVERFEGLNQHLSKLLYERRKEFREQGVCLLTRLEMDSMLKNHFGHKNGALLAGSWSSWTHAQTSLVENASKKRDDENEQEDEKQGKEQQEEEEQEERDNEEQREGEEQEARDNEVQQEGEAPEEDDEQRKEEQPE